MGWSFRMNRNIRKKELVEELISPNSLSPGYSIIEHRIVGNNLWYLYSRPNGEKTIGLFLLAPGGNEMGWGYKGMNEDSGPCQLDCPVSLINKCDPPESDWAREWREKVLVNRNEKKKKDEALRANALVRIYGKEYKLLYKITGSTKWTVKEIETGKLFTVKKSMLDSAAEIIDERKETTEMVIAEKAAPIQEEMFA